ncbi:MAG TPA: glycosyltransferase family 2 protein [Vicinamibacterales bacterium]|nr:glycosyltransferase family 2 protein [Vicinamibacterales bacterium]
MIAVSVVVATKNRAGSLSGTLRALLDQEPGSPYEIVVADNGSTDDTRRVVEAAAAERRVPVVYLRDDRPGKPFALNTALTRARGRLLAFTDDDVLPSRTWLSAIVRAFDRHRADFVAGRILPLWEAPPPAWLSPALYGVLGTPDAGVERLPIRAGENEHVMPIGANMAASRAALERVGGWDPALGKLEGTLRTGEDHDLFCRMLAAGLTGVYEPAAVVHHRVPADRLRRGYFRRWFYGNGAVTASLDRRYMPGLPRLLGVPRYLWRQAAADLIAFAAGTLAGDAPRAAAGEMRLAWFAGYLRAAWSRRGDRPAGPAAPRAA